MPQEGVWSTIWAKISTVRQGVGVIGQLCAVAVVVFIVLGVGLRSIGADLYVSVIVLLGMAMVCWLFRDFVTRALKFANDNPDHATVSGQHLVQLRRLDQAWRGKAQDALPPNANVEPKAIMSEIIESEGASAGRNAGWVPGPGIRAPFAISGSSTMPLVLAGLKSRPFLILRLSGNGGSPASPPSIFCTPSRRSITVL